MECHFSHKWPAKMQKKNDERAGVDEEENRRHQRRSSVLCVSTFLRLKWGGPSAPECETHDNVLTLVTGVGIWAARDTFKQSSDKN